MFKKAIILVLFAAFFNVMHGNIFTDPTKLARLVEFQIRVVKILQASEDVELLNIPQDILVGLIR